MRRSDEPKNQPLDDEKTVDTSGAPLSDDAEVTEPFFSDADEGSSAHRWTFLTNHAHVLVLLYSEPGLVLRQVASRVGITERAVQRIIHDLEEAGVIRRQKVGRQNQYEVLADRPLRHPIEAHRSIQDLLNLFEGQHTSKR